MSPQPMPNPACLFCQIIAGTREAEVVFESRTTIAFLDRVPVAPGHTLVVPKRHAATLLDLDEGSAGALFGSLVEVVETLQEALHPVGFNIGWNHGAAAGQHVFHLHVHVLPRLQGGGAGIQAVGEGAPAAALADVGSLIRAGRQRTGPGDLAGGRPRAPSPWTDRYVTAPRASISMSRSTRPSTSPPRRPR